MNKPNKLVRDKIPAIIESRGAKVITHTLSDQEYVNELERKLQEEVSEYLSDKNVEELADIVEVVYALAQLLDTSSEKLESIRKKKALANGAFAERIYLEEIIEQTS